MGSLHEQLHAAWESSGLSLPQLRDRAGLACTAASLSRKLRGLQVMSTEECTALALALDARVFSGASAPAPEAA